MQNRVRQLLGWLHDHILEFNFYRLHMTYFVLSILVSSAIFWTSSTDGRNVQYIDALIMCASAMTNCGLTTINLGAINGYQQSVLFVLMALGDLSIVSISIVLIRRYFFSRKIHSLLKHSKAARRLAEDIDQQRGKRQAQLQNEQNPAPHKPSRTETFGKSVDDTTGSSSHSIRPSDRDQASNQQQWQPSTASTTRRRRAHTGYGGWPAPWETDIFCKVIKFPSRSLHHKPTPDHHYLSFSPNLDHKGRFRNLTSAQVEELGGVEYRSLCTLTWILPSYTLLWLCFTWVVLIPYTTETSSASIIRTTQPGATSPAWWATFAGLSAYSNTGLNLLSQNMIPLRHDYLILIITGTAIVAGNTFYPILLRLSIWTLSKVVPKHSELHHSLAFLLHHPRRCFLFLFPAKNTWYLLGVQLGVFLLLWLAFEILNIDYSPLLSDISDPGQLAINGLYQTLGVRSSGYYITNQSNLSPACQIFFMVNMYISAIPFIISLRSTNIYEERSIGIDSDTKKDPDHQKSNNPKPPSPTIQTHLQSQLAYDIWWIVLAVFLISTIERGALSTSSPGYSLFSIIFEVVSGYGSVGLSLGLPYDTTSFCGAWDRLSKLILVTVMLRGRHRILPLAVDRAVLVPGQELMERIDEDEMLGDDEDKDGLWERYEDEIRTEEEGEQAEHGGPQDPEASRVCG